jgi:diguanylate cyclase (GGDEF)-like protein
METGTGPTAWQALCRFLEARTGMSAIAVYRVTPSGDILLHATPAYVRLRTDEAQRLSAVLGEAGSLRRLDPRSIGLSAAVTYIQSCPGPEADGTRLCIVLASRRMRRIGSRAAAAIADAAAIAAGLGTGPGTGGFASPSAQAPPGGGAEAGEEEAAIASHSPARGPAPGRTVPGAVATMNRTALHQLIASILRARGRAGQPAFLMVDIDRFRAINEGLGAEAGDLALAATASRIGDVLEERDRVIRLDSDRFLVITVACHRPVEDIAGAILAAIAEPIRLASRRLALTASIGVVVPVASEISPVRVLMQADMALRRAKAAGGARIEVHEPGAHAALLERSLLELDLRHALEEGQFSLVYQPYIRLSTGRIDGVEALLRWRHPTRGEIAPSTFIPLAEATGQILPIGMWALSAACAEAARHPGAGFLLSVNISPLQFHAPGFVDQVDAALARTGFPPSRLELEITETVLMRDNPDTTAQLRALIARGIRIGLDDFGTGYSALAYLSRLPHHRIKLDKSFVQDLARPSTAGLMRAIIALARAGGIDTTAEGVESEDQLLAVRGLGFSHAQGFATGATMSDLAPLAEGIGAG